MILGRTDDNKIKIKTDSPKGLRAVECACCGVISCTITQMQFNAIRYGFTTNISATQGIGTMVPVIQLYEYSFQNPTEDREEIFGVLSSDPSTYSYVVSTTGPFTCIVNGPPGSGITYPVQYYNINTEYLTVYLFYTAWIPNNPQIAPTYFLNASNGVQYFRTEIECPNDGGVPATITKDSKQSFDLCGEEMYSFIIGGAPWPPQP